VQHEQTSAVRGSRAERLETMELDLVTIGQRSTRVSSGSGRRTSFPQSVRTCAPGTHHAGV